MPSELKSREEKAVKFENVNSALQAKKLPLKYNQLKLFYNGEANYSEMGRAISAFYRNPM